MWVSLGENKTVAKRGKYFLQLLVLLTISSLSPTEFYLTWYLGTLLPVFIVVSDRLATAAVRAQYEWLLGEQFQRPDF